MNCTPCNFDPTIAHHFAAGLYAKESRVPAGYVVGKHIHAYSHLSVLAQGVAKVTAGDVVIEYTAPACIEIKAGIQHKVEAVTDVIWYCIHSTDETDKDRVDEVLIHKEE
jgi:quercetin dioxygenase-like cupin family protein